MSKIKMNPDRKVFLGLLVVFAWTSSAFGRTITPLGGAGWTCDGGPVTVPHTWNAADACDGPNGTTMKWNGDSAKSTNSYVRKRAVYRRTLQVSPKHDRRYFLKFEGASVKADVTLNGRPVGRHVGAFTAFAFEVTDFLEDGENALEVGVDNRYDESTQPMSADFSVFGGLYRPVWLIETGRVCIDPVTDGADGVKVAADPKTGEVTVDVSVLGGTNEVQRFRVEGFELWSPENPKLYARTVSIDQGGTTDAVEIRFAFRTFEFREDGFYLNGRKRQLRGVNRHQDRAGKGWAVSPADEEEDIRLIKEMGADALRTAHYPNSRHIYDLCDELGLIVWLEYPNVNMLTFTDEFERGMHRQIREMVAQHRNHPSVAMWSMWNELYVVDWEDGEGWVLDPEKALGLTTRTRDLIHRLDPSRPVVAATDKPRMRDVNDVPDQLAYNRYPGWYSTLAMHEMLSEMFAADDRKVLGMSEYGIGGSVRQHGDPTVGVAPGGPWHPEEYQAWRMHDNLLEMTRDARIWGHYVWAMFDFAADRRTEGDRHGINDKGLVTHDHRTKKDAYYLYQAAWSKVPTLHLVGSRMTSVTNDVVNVLGFSNVGDVTLFVNGREVGHRAPDEVGGVFWSRVKLELGENRVELRAGDRSSGCVWKREDKSAGT